MNKQRDLKTQRFIKCHGMTKTRIHRVWCSMRERCSNVHNKSYKNYGGRGISVCQEWQDDFMNFYNWAIANGYDENAKYGECTLDRIDVNDNYYPENCRWVDIKTQNRNYSKNHLITYNGETLCLTDMAIKYGIKPATVLWRIKNNKSLDEVFNDVDYRKR